MDASDNDEDMEEEDENTQDAINESLHDMSVNEKVNILFPSP